MISNKAKNTLLTLAGLAVGVPLAIGLAIYSFFQATSTTLHPDPQAVRSVTQVKPSPRWANAAEQARQHARTGLVQQNLPGLSVAVGVAGEIVWSEGLGWADLEKRIPVAPGMRFRIGHASKALTSAAVGLLVEQGRLRLDDDIQTYVPAFPTKRWPVTVRQLMGHIAGVRHYQSEEDSCPPRIASAHPTGCSVSRTIRCCSSRRPGTGYSTFGWILVSAAVEAVAGEPFFTFMRTQVFTPLGMADTTPDTGDRTDPGSGDLRTTRDSVKASVSGPTMTPPSTTRVSREPAGSCPRRPTWCGSGWRSTTATLLKPDTVRKLQTPQPLASGEDTDYGLGWMLETFALAGEPTRLASHASRTPLGASTSFLTFPDRGLVVAVMTNMSSKDTRSIALKIAEAFAEQGQSPARQ